MAGDGCTAGEQSGGGFTALATLDRGVAVVTLEGRLGPLSLPACRAAIDESLRGAGPWIVLDLAAVVFDDWSVALLSLMRRYTARHGGRLVIAAAPDAVRRELDRACVSALYPMLPTVDGALEAAADVLRLPSERVGGMR